MTSRPFPRWRSLLGALLAVLCAIPAPALSPDQLAEIERYEHAARLALSPSELRQYAIRLAQLPDQRSVRALAAILQRCDEFEAGTIATVNPKSLDIARGYALHALATLRTHDPTADSVIRDHFRLTPAACVALYRARYPAVYELIAAEITRLLHTLPPVIYVRSLEPLTPAWAFAVRARPELFPDLQGATPSPSGAAPDLDFPHRSAGNNTIFDVRTTLEALTTAAVLLDHSRAPQALQPLELLCQHPYAFLWDKPVYRAVYNLRMSADQRAATLRRALRANRNRDRDTCRWNWEQPSSILFTINTISSEAMLVLTLWRLPGQLSAKLADVQPSLRSTSFTARAAAIDCLASLPRTTHLLAPVVREQDRDTRRFLAFRLRMETNQAARALLARLTNDTDARVAAFARE